MSNKKLYTGTLKLLLGTFASRILGFVREMLAARFVGAGHKMDVFALAYRIDNLTRGILGEKAAESAYLPVYKTLSAQGKHAEAQAVSADTFKLLLAVLFVISALAFMLAPLFVRIMGNGFAGQYFEDGTDKFAAAVTATRLLVPLILMVGFFSFLGARQLAHERFTAYSIAPVLANTCAIAVLVFTFRAWDWYCLMFAALAGACAECFFFWMLSDNRRTLFGEHVFSLNLANPHLRQAGALWVPITFGSVLEKTGTVIESLMASYLGKGAVAALYYGNLLNLLSFSVLGLSFNRSIIPHLTEKNAQQNHAEFRSGILTGIRMNLILLLPVSVFVIMLAGPLVELLFQRGQFDAGATGRTSLTLACYSVGLVAMGWMALFSRAFYALLDAKTPIKVSVVSLCVNVALNFALWKTPLRQAGLALATSIAYWTNALIMLWLLNRRLAATNSSIHAREVLGLLWRVALPAALVAGTVYVAWPLALQWMPGTGIVDKTLRVALTGCGALFVFAGAGLLCGIEEIKLLARKMLLR